MPAKSKVKVLPGQPVRGSASGRPIMALLDLLGRRWALRILWELRDGPLGFRALQAACAGMSPSVLNQRLSELRAAALIESDQGSNQLSPLGQQLLAQFAPLNDWAEHWAGQLPLDEPSTPR